MANLPRSCLSFLMISCPSQWAEVQGSPWFPSCWAGEEDPCTSLQLLQALWSALSPGVAAGLLPSPGGSWEDLTPRLRDFFPFYLPKWMFACLHSDMLALPSDPGLLLSSCPATAPSHTGEHSVSLLLLLKKEPPASATERGTFKEQTFEISLPNTQAGRSQIPVPWNSHSAWDKPPLAAAGAVSTGHKEQTGILRKKRPGWRDCHHVLPWLTSVAHQAAVCLLL